MASAIEAGKRLEGLYAVRDTVTAELATWAGLEMPVMVPGVRQPQVIALANQAAVDAVLLQTMQQLVARVEDLEPQLAATSE